MAVNVVSFWFSWCSTGGLGVHSAGCWLSLQHPISNFSGPQTPSRASSAGSGFPYHSSSITPSPTVIATPTQLPWFLSWLSYIIVQRTLDRPLDLWNRMFNRHQAEITVMQFRGHSLPVRQSMRVSWIFLARPISSASFRPRDFLSQLPLECVTSFRCITLNGILGRVEGQNTTISPHWHFLWFLQYLCCWENTVQFLRKLFKFYA